MNDAGRNETDQERLDRLWGEQLQELRVLQTGVQLLGGFLLTLPFQSTFADLDALQHALFLFLVAVAGITTLTVMTPISVHRALTGHRIKDRVVSAGSTAMRVAISGVALLVVGMTTFIFDVVVGRSVSPFVAALAGLLAVALLVVVPRRLSRTS